MDTRDINNNTRSRPIVQNGTGQLIQCKAKSNTINSSRDVELWFAIFAWLHPINIQHNYMHCMYHWKSNAGSYNHADAETVIIKLQVQRKNVYTMKLFWKYNLTHTDIL